MEYTAVIPFANSSKSASAGPSSGDCVLQVDEAQLSLPIGRVEECDPPQSSLLGGSHDKSPQSHGSEPPQRQDSAGSDLPPLFISTKSGGSQLFQPAQSSGSVSGSGSMTASLPDATGSLSSSGTFGGSFAPSASFSPTLSAAANGAVERVTQRLNEARKNAHKRVTRLRFMSLTIGGSLAVAGLGISRMSSQYSVVYVAAWFFVFLATGFPLLAILPSDAKWSSLALVAGYAPLVSVVGGICLLDAYLFWQKANSEDCGDCAIGDYRVPGWFAIYYSLKNGVAFGVCMTTVVWMVITWRQKLHAAQNVRRLWLALGIMHGYFGVGQIAQSVCAIAVGSFVAFGSVTFTFVQLAISGACFDGRVVHLLQSWLMSFGEGASISADVAVARKKADAKLLRLRVQGMVFSILLVVGGDVAVLLGNPFSGLGCLGCSLVLAGHFGVALILMPTDRRAVPLATVLGLIPSIVLQAAYNLWYAISSLRSTSDAICKIGEKTVPCWYALMFGIGSALQVLLHVAIGTWTSVKLWKNRGDSKAQFKNYWTALAAIMVCFPPMRFVFALVLVVTEEMTEAFFVLMLSIEFILDIGFAGVGVNKNLIRRTQGWLMAQGGAATAAASIAELLGGRDIEEVLAAAKRTFTSVTAHRLLYADMEQNTPNPALGKLARKATLGFVDAFISHSWRDNPALKWAALQKWREEFKAKHSGREPRLWIDKYCIDQYNIEDCLACLPVCLAGCTKLVVLCGQSYLQRLWCLIEIFVFLEMGGDFDNLEIYLLQEEDAAADTLPAQILDFDCQKAESSSADDTARLQEILEVANFGKINILVRSVFEAKVPALKERLASASATSVGSKKRLSRATSRLFS